MSNIVLSWNIISELQKTPEWYHLNQKTIFYRSKRSKPGPNRSIWRILSKLRIFRQKIPKNIYFFIVRGVFLGPSEGFGTGFGLIRMKKWWIFFSNFLFFLAGPVAGRPAPGPGSRTGPGIIEKPARQPGSWHQARVAGDPDRDTNYRPGSRISGTGPGLTGK